MIKMLKRIFVNKKVKRKTVQSIVNAIKRNHEVQKGVRDAICSKSINELIKQESYET